jgi:hypothetical protein
MSIVKLTWEFFPPSFTQRDDFEHVFVKFKPFGLLFKKFEVILPADHPSSQIVPPRYTGVDPCLIQKASQNGNEQVF